MDKTEPSTKPKNWFDQIKSKVKGDETKAPPPTKKAQSSLEHPLWSQLDEQERHLDERIRTLCLVVVAIAVISGACYFLQNILIPFVLALALAYLLTPIIDLLSCQRCNMPYKLPRVISTFIAIFLAFGLVFVIGLIVATSISEFTENAGLYRERVEYIIGSAYNLTIEVQRGLGLDEDMEEDTMDLSAKSFQAIKDFINQISITDLILTFLGSAAAMTEDVTD